MQKLNSQSSRFEWDQKEEEGDDGQSRLRDRARSDEASNREMVSLRARATSASVRRLTSHFEGKGKEEEEEEEEDEEKDQGWFEGQSTRFPKQPSRVSERSELPSELLNERSVPGE